MNREEFLKVLKESLTMSLEKDAINDQLDYYDKYISDEIKKGRSEKEVIEELGDPRLIAKTIKTVSANDNSTVDNNSNNSDNNYNSGSQGNYSNYNDSRTSSRNYGGYGQNNRNNRSYGGYANNNGTIGCIIAGLVMFIIVYGLLRFMGNLAYGVGELAFSGGPIGLLLVIGLFYLLFGRGKR